MSAQDHAHTVIGATLKSAATARYIKRLALSVVGGLGVFELALAASEVVGGHITSAMWMALLGFWLLRSRDLEMRVEDLTPKHSITWSAFCARVVGNVPDAERDAVQYALDLALVGEGA